AAEPASRKPTTGIARGCCTRAASGHAATAPPSAASNSRRRMVTVIRPPVREVRKGNCTLHQACSLQASVLSRVGRPLQFVIPLGVPEQQHRSLPQNILIGSTFHPPLSLSRNTVLSCQRRDTLRRTVFLCHHHGNIFPQIKSRCRQRLLPSSPIKSRLVSS